MPHRRGGNTCCPGIAAPPRARNILIAITILSCLPGISAPRADEALNLEMLMALLAGVEFAKAEFRETLHYEFLEQDFELDGILEYRSPDFIEKRVSTIPRQSISIKGDRVLIEQGSNTRVLSTSDHDLLKALVGTLRAILAGDLKYLQDHYETKFASTRIGWTLTLRSHSTSGWPSPSSITVRGSGREITAIDIYESNGDYRAMRLKTLEIRPGAHP